MALRCDWCNTPLGPTEYQPHDNPDFAEYKTCRGCGYQWAKKYWDTLRED